MSRPQKKKIELSKESLLSLMQEIYNELVEQRSTALRIQNKMLSMMKDPEDMTLIGPVIEKQQKIINDCVDKKLQLSKLQSSIWEKSANKEESFSISDMDDDLIDDLIKKDVESNKTFKYLSMFFLIECLFHVSPSDILCSLFKVKHVMGAFIMI